MNDHHLDPPDDFPEPPPCPECRGPSDVKTDTPTHYVMRCEDCGHEWNEEHPTDPPDCLVEDDDLDDIADACRECGQPSGGCVYCSTECAAKNPCPHGNTPGDCDACDHAADLAFDAARESR